MIHFRSWLTLPSPKTTLDGEDSSQIPKNLGHFWHFGFFLLKKKTGISALCVMPPGARFWWEPPNDKNSAFLDLAWKTYACIPMAKKFGEVLSPQKRQKHSKNDLIAPILTHRKQCWENWILEVQMEAKLENFTWVGNQTGRPFQQAHLEWLWTLGRPSKVSPNRCYA